MTPREIDEMDLTFPSTARKCQPEARLLHQPVHALPFGPIMSLFPPALSPSLFPSVAEIGLPLSDSLYLHTSTNPEFFCVPCFFLRENPCRTCISRSRTLTVSGLFLSFCPSPLSLSLVLSLICTQYTRSLVPVNGRKFFFYFAGGPLLPPLFLSSSRSK